MTALRQQRIAQHAERLTLGEAWRGLDLVFPSEEGIPITLSNLLRRSFRPLLARAGCPRIRFHELRHTVATLLPEQGINVQYSAEMLGHAGIAVTLDLDGHATPTMQRRVVSAMEALASGRGGCYSGLLPWIDWVLGTRSPYCNVQA